MDLAKKHGGVNLLLQNADSPEGDIDIISANLHNDSVEGFIKDIEKFEDIRVTLLPGDVLAMYPPGGDIARQVSNPRSLSPIEVYLKGIQSVSSWTNFVAFAAVGGIIAWAGLFTNAVYLMVAAMLIAPIASPIMNIAIATSRGDIKLFWNSTVRFLVSLLIIIAISYGLSVIADIEIPTNLMINVAELSEFYMILPMAAGAAGALSLTNSERSSLISGAAIGMLVSVSLAPPASVIGIAIAMNRWDFISSGLLSVTGTLLGVTLGGTVVFRWYGLATQGSLYERGEKYFYYAIVTITALILLSLLSWQFFAAPQYLTQTREQRAEELAREIVMESRMAEMLNANARYTDITINNSRRMLTLVYVRKGEDTKLPAETISYILSDKIRNSIEEKMPNTLPVVEVNVLE